MSGEPPTPAQWDAATSQYDAYLDTPGGRLRDVLTWYHLQPLLPPIDPTDPPLVLDAGCGPGRMTARLATLGYRVRAIDPAPAMLALAHERVAALPPEVAARVEIAEANLAAVPHLVAPASCAAIICHNVLEFVPDPTEAIQTLAGVLQPGGIISILTLNRWSEILRAAINSHDPAAVLAALDQRVIFEQMTGGQRRMNDADEITEWLATEGIEVVGLHGVRVLSDYLLGASYEEQLAVELAVAARADAAFARLGRQVAIFGRKARGG
jgi:S-adenosylmethionine-dependent methyltransferase